jgi:uncharacterized protein DUF955
MEEIERRAEAVLASVPSWVWDGESLPVPVEDIVDTCFGLLVRDVDDLSAAPGAPALAPDQALSGLLFASRGEIWVNAEEARQWPPRRRFTICHELGHWCMHRVGHDAVFCRSSTVEPVNEGAEPPPTPQIEEEAQVFAAAVLMPAHLLREQYARDPDFFGLCDTFGASGAAMGRRLHAVVPRAG